LGGTGVFISRIVNPIINSVKFSFWMSVYTVETIEHMTGLSLSHIDFFRYLIDWTDESWHSNFNLSYKNTG